MLISFSSHGSLSYCSTFCVYSNIIIMYFVCVYYRVLPLYNQLCAWLCSVVLEASNVWRMWIMEYHECMCLEVWKRCINVELWSVVVCIRKYGRGTMMLNYGVWCVYVCLCYSLGCSKPLCVECCICMCCMCVNYGLWWVSIQDMYIVKCVREEDIGHHIFHICKKFLLLSVRSWNMVTYILSPQSKLAINMNNNKKHNH